MTTPIAFEEHIKSYQQQQAKCAHLIHLAHQIWLRCSAELLLGKETIRDKSSREVWQHYYQKSQKVDAVSLDKLIDFAEKLSADNLPSDPIDLMEWAGRPESITPLAGTRISQLTANGGYSDTVEPRDVVLYGFGRIGRLIARALIDGIAKGSPLRLRAIVTRDKLDRETLIKRANLLRFDSIHGGINASVDVDLENNGLRINGLPVAIISASTPEQIDYTGHGINNALIIDNTGVFRDARQLSRHLDAAGTASVLLTAPGKGVPNIVMGVNDKQLFQADEAPNIVCAASCTTNAIAPVLAIIQEHIGIRKGHVETIHAYTNDQNLVDNMHKKSRRGRAAALNMVITETGAGAAVAQVLPQLAGKLTSNAIRVPVPNGSLAILHLELEQPCSRDELHELLGSSSQHGPLSQQIDFSNDQELVSSDIIGTSAAAIVDSLATQVSPDQHTVVVYLWYDNEYGYTHQVLRLAEKWARVSAPAYC